MLDVILVTFIPHADNEAYWDDEGNIICSGQEEDFAALSQGMQKLYLLQELLGNLGFEA